MIARWLRIPAGGSALVLGPRRAGKTTLLRHRFPDAPYFTLDDFDVLRLARRDPKALVRALGPLGILDEVQREPEVLIAVKYGIDEGKQTVLLTGSSVLGLESGGAETLAGRIARLSCPTFCWGEEEGACTHRSLAMPPSPLQVAEGARRMKRAMALGGFPEVVLAADEAGAKAVLRNYRDTYFTKDLLLLSNIESADALMAMMAYLAVSTGSAIDVSNVAREAGVSHPTARKYLNVLVSARLAFRVSGYHYGPAKRYVRAAKYYFSDIGIVEALGIPLSPGQRLEAWVASELEKRRALGRFDAERLFHYRSAGGAEIDLVIEEPGGITAVEVKHTRTVARHDLANLRAFSKHSTRRPCRAVLLYLGEEAYADDGVEVLPVASLWRAF